MTRPINGFNGRFRFLSNFWESDYEVRVGLTQDKVGDNQWFMVGFTSEHVYQAAKVEPGKYNQVREAILRAPSPATAKRWGSTAILREGWEEMKVDVMTQIVRAKFTQNPDLKQRLLDTEDAYIEETNYWGDTFWGVCKGKGDNHLGKILMQVRHELAQNKPS